MACVDWRMASYMIIVVTTSHGPEWLKIADVQGTGNGHTRTTSQRPEQLKIAGRDGDVKWRLLVLFLIKK